MALMAIWQFTAYCPKIHVSFVILYRIYGLKQINSLTSKC